MYPLAAVLSVFTGTGVNVLVTPSPFFIGLKLVPVNVGRGQVGVGSPSAGVGTHATCEDVNDGLFDVGLAKKLPPRIMKLLLWPSLGKSNRSEPVVTTKGHQLV